MSFKPNPLRSQHFLIDETVIQKMIQLSEIQPHETIIEIGAGTGNLTKHLLKTSAEKIIAIEKDSRAKKILSSFVSNHFFFIIQDVLDFHFESYEKFKVVANLPYHITQKILEKFCNVSSRLLLGVFMVQKEVAEKLTQERIASPFILQMQLHFEIQILCVVSKNCFDPKPKVDSAIIRLRPKPVYPFTNQMIKMARIAFHSRRKKLSKNLQKFAEKQIITSAFQKMMLNENTRPDNLNKEEWIRLYLLLANP